jgi:hypothetical protein
MVDAAGMPAALVGAGVFAGTTGAVVYAIAQREQTSTSTTTTTQKLFRRLRRTLDDAG